MKGELEVKAYGKKTFWLTVCEVYELQMSRKTFMKWLLGILEFTIEEKDKFNGRSVIWPSEVQKFLEATGPEAQPK